MVAKCTSKKCVTALGKRITPAIKQVKPGTMHCHDCGYVLVWKKTAKSHLHTALNHQRATNVN